MGRNRATCVENGGRARKRQRKEGGETDRLTGESSLSSDFSVASAASVSHARGFTSSVSLSPTRARFSNKRAGQRPNERERAQSIKIREGLREISSKHTGFRPEQGNKFTSPHCLPDNTGYVQKNCGIRREREGPTFTEIDATRWARIPTGPPPPHTHCCGAADRPRPSDRDRG